MTDLHEDSVPLLSAAAGPKVFRITNAPARLAVSGSGTLESWDGTTWDSGLTFTRSQAIMAPGRYRITLDAPGNASIQETGAE